MHTCTTAASTHTVGEKREKEIASYLSLKKRRKPKAISLRMDSSTKVEVKK